MGSVTAARCSTAACGLLAGGVLATAMLAALTATSADDPTTAGRTTAGDRPNVLIVVLDTVRADRLGCYGYDRATTPHIDAFARRAVRFSSFHATSSWTLPSHASLLTGLYPLRHGATQERRTLDDSYTTLAEVLAGAGYRTWAASGNPFVGPATNLDQGFGPGDFLETWRQRAGRNCRHPANAGLARFLKRRDPDRPFFALVNYIEAHMPYTPPDAGLDRFLDADVDWAAARRLGRRGWAAHYLETPYTPDELRVLSQLYDAEIAALDAVLGDLLDILSSDGRLDDTLVVLTADHGEQFGEHGLVEHVFGLYDVSVRIPLLLRRPGGQGGGRVEQRPGQLVDLFPTVLAACGVAPGSEHHGYDLLAADPGARRDFVLSEYYWPAQVLGSFEPDALRRDIARIRPHLRRLRAFQRDGLRLVWSSDGRHEIYDLTVDPGETRNLFDAAGPRPSRVGRLLADFHGTLQRLAGEAGLPPPPDVMAALRGVFDPGTHAALRSLGYAD